LSVVIVPENDSEEGHHGHAVEEEREKDDDNEHVERAAPLRTQAHSGRGFSIIDTPTTNKRLHQSTITQTPDY